MLSSLLAGYTRMPVHEVMNDMPVERDHVYVIPPNARLAIQRGRLKLLRQEESAATGHRAIDHFFRSLAEDLGGRAVGVLMSGTGSGGVLGLQAIKAIEQDFAGAGTKSFLVNACRLPEAGSAGLAILIAFLERPRVTA